MGMAPSLPLVALVSSTHPTHTHPTHTSMWQPLKESGLTLYLYTDLFFLFFFTKRPFYFRKTLKSSIFWIFTKTSLNYNGQTHKT